MSKTILIMAGGTGGHIFPGLAVADELRVRGHHVMWLGTEHGLDTQLVPAANIPYYQIAIKGLRGKGKLSLLLAPFKITKAVTQAWQIMRKLRPDAVIGFGGYVTGPSAIAAKLLGIPIIIHEQNAIAGKTNLILARIAKKVLVAFPNCFPTSVGAIWVGNPVRTSICQISAPEQRYHDRRSPLNLLVFGGSQGAKGINDAVLVALQQLWRKLPVENRPAVWHQVGKVQLVEMQERYQAANISVKLEPFIADMAAAYAWADLVICRSGALTVSELAVAGVPAVLIPFPQAVDDHQTANAQFLVERDAAMIIQQRDLNPAQLVAIIEKFGNNSSLLLTMACNARRVAKPDATAQVADYCVQVSLGVAR
jgi:UDP-N-acetylglucosamine--N-acetylmuramyl-(pentapeptide) pyrophosphoryl-undecaprenol N-acetylglucosamine transferase